MANPEPIHKIAKKLAIANLRLEFEGNSYSKEVQVHQAHAKGSNENMLNIEKNPGPSGTINQGI